MTATNYQWPNEARFGVLITFDVDAEAPHLWRSRGTGPRLAELEQRRFGPRQGVGRLLGMLADRRLAGTFYVPGHVARHHASAVAEIVAAGHELALHGDMHEAPTDVTEEEFRDATSRSIDALGSLLGHVPAGFRSPSWDMTPEAFEVLMQLGIRHDSSLMGLDHPYWIGPIVEVPVQWALDDAPYLRYVGRGDTRPPTPARDLVASWLHELEAARKFGTLFTLTMHPWMSGRPGPAHAIGELFDAIGESDAWVGTVGDLARWHAGAHREGMRLSVGELVGATP